MTHILVICQDQELKAKIRLALEELPVRIVKEVDSGKKIADVLAETAADLVIVDLFIPTSSGLEVLKAVKKVKESAQVIMLSRLRTRGAIDKAFRFGAQDVLVLPVDADTLRETVAHRLELPPTPGAARAGSGAGAS